LFAGLRTGTALYVRRIIKRNLSCERVEMGPRILAYKSLNII
jgi:hypothetical protein